MADYPRDVFRQGRNWHSALFTMYGRTRLTCYGQGYELSEEEVRISLDEFRDKFTDPLGAPEYVLANAFLTYAEFSLVVRKCPSRPDQLPK